MAAKSHIFLLILLLESPFARGGCGVLALILAFYFLARGEWGRARARAKCVYGACGARVCRAGAWLVGTEGKKGRMG